jgi:hypothetical protein
MSSEAPKEAPKEAPECPICVEKYTRILRHPVECPKCQQSVCSKCMQRYICETIDDPHCVHCKHPFDKTFLNNQLTKAFMKGEYITKRKELLWNREESYLPAAMGFVEISNDLKKIMARRKEINDIMDTLRVEDNTAHHTSIKYKRAIDTGVMPNNLEKKEEYMQKFIRRCMVESCRGWLSNAWKCGACDTHTCAKCYVVKGKKGAEIDLHVCKQEDIDTADYIRKNAKNCPKCGEMIEKKDGCDMMFCTGCHTAFSWKTLEISTGAIHNPHYFAWRDRTGRQERTVGDIQCGGVPDHQMFAAYSDIEEQYFIPYQNDLYGAELFDHLDTPTTKKYKVEKRREGRDVRNLRSGVIEREEITLSKYHKMYKVFSRLCRFLNHIHSYIEAHGKFNYNEEDYNKMLRHMRIEYLNNNTTKEAYQMFLCMQEKKREKIRALANPIDVFYNAGADILMRAIPSVENIGIDMTKRINWTPENYELLFTHGRKLIGEMDELRKFINDTYKVIAKNMAISVLIIDPHYNETMN